MPPTLRASPNVSDALVPAESPRAEEFHLGFGPFGFMVVDLVIQLGLDGLEEVLIDNGRLLTFEDFALESDLADIEAIAKQMRE